MEKGDKKIRLAYLVTHPIQYQAPLLKRIAQEKNIELTVFFCSDFSLYAYKDEGFGQSVEWDVPLLDGYKHEFLPSLGDNKKISFFRPFNYGLFARLKKGEFDYLWIHSYARWINWCGIIFSKLLGIKVLIRDEANNFSAKRSDFKNNLKKIFFKGLSYFVDGFLAIGTMNRQYYLDHGIPSEKIFLSPYTVDNDFFQKKISYARKNAKALCESLQIMPHRPIILFASKMTERKGALDLLKAYENLSTDKTKEPDPYLIFVGDGEQRHLLEERAASLGWDSIKFVGFKNQKELPDYYALADIFVLPSYHEPWGLVINEAMNAGCAIISADEVGASADLVKPEINGQLCKAQNVQSLTDALLNVLEHLDQMKSNSLKIIDNWGYKQTIDGIKTACHFKGKESDE